MSDQIFYHFLSSKNAIHDLERKMIRVSTLDTLNDPFELMPYLRYRDRQKRKWYLNIRKEMSKKYGLLCFSESLNEPLLWGYYADKHKGIAIGFDILKRDEILDVVYDADPIRKQFDLTNDPRINEKLFLDLAKIKYQEWHYEKEYRVLVKLEECTKIDGHYFIQFKDRLKVKEIVLGCNYDNNKEYVIELAEQLDAKVIPTRMEMQGYRIIRRNPIWCPENSPS